MSGVSVVCGAVVGMRQLLRSQKAQIETVTPDSEFSAILPINTPRIQFLIGNDRIEYLCANSLRIDINVLEYRPRSIAHLQLIYTFHAIRLHNYIITIIHHTSQPEVSSQYPS